MKRPLSRGRSPAAAGSLDLPDPDIVARLRSGDERMFRAVVRRHHSSLVGVAIGFVGSRATAEEVAQDTWLAVIEGVASFEQRSSLKNWIFAILVNKARTRAMRDGRTVPIADFAAEADAAEPIVDPSRFNAAGMWERLPALWDEVTPERIVAGKQLWSHVTDAIETLPPGQRSVLILRGVELMSAHEVSALLGITDANQRVLLHRARARIRDVMETLLGK